MKFLFFSLVVIFSFAMLSMGVVQNVEARGADEPCSYLKPHEWTRDASGNCVRASSVPVTASPSVSSRSVHEPCSYLNPTKYVRDSAGICHEVVASAPAPQAANAATPGTYAAPKYQSGAGFTSTGSSGAASTGDSGIVSTLLMMLGPAAIGIVLSKNSRTEKELFEVKGLLHSHFLTNFQDGAGGRCATLKIDSKACATRIQTGYL